MLEAICYCFHKQDSTVFSGKKAVQRGRDLRKSIGFFSGQTLVRFQNKNIISTGHFIYFCHMNTFEDFIAVLRSKMVSSRLPGMKAQLKMAPAGRKSELSTVAENPRESAVLISFFPKNNQPHLVMIKRAVDKSVHSGQVSFPGGKAEKSDPSLKHTALREAEEEVGITPSKVEVLGKLSDLYIPPSNFSVTPFVGFLTKEPDFVTNGEVDRLLIINWNHLTNPANTSLQRLQHRTGSIEAPCYLINGDVIWGASAMILAELIEVITSN